MDKRRTRDRQQDAAEHEDIDNAGTNRTGDEMTAEAERTSEPTGDDVPAATTPTTGETAAAARALELERDKYLRLAAEFDNYRKRAVKERQEAGWRAQSELVTGLLEALDDIMRFAHLDPSSVDSDTVVQGVGLVEKKLLKSLGGHGLEVLNPVDQPFDPAFHEAVGTEPALSREDDHLIAKVYQPGYVFRGQLMRPARVVVRQWLG